MIALRASRPLAFIAARGLLVVTLLAGGCSPAPDGPSSVTLTAVTEEAVFTDTPDTPPPSPVAWNFAEGTTPGETDAEMLGARAMHHIESLEMRDGLLQGRTTGNRPILHIPVPEDAELEDQLHSVEVRIRLSGGSIIALAWWSGQELDEEEIIERAEERQRPPALNAPVVDGDELHTYTLSASLLTGGGPPLRSLRHLLLLPGREANVEFALESVRLISRKEHLQRIPSGVSWQGLGEIYRETLVTRAPERVELPVRVPGEPWLDLHVGTIEPGPATFEVSVQAGGESVELLRRTVTTPGRWEQLEIDLSAWAGRDVTLGLRGTAIEEGNILFWGGPVIRSRGDTLHTARPSDARAALGENPVPPRRILFILADTLRRDRLPWHGGQRDNAPVLSRIAEEGTVFTNNVSQGTWTKVSVPSILTSLYPTSHGLVEPPDRLPSSVDTLAELLREAGYATYATSSVPFTGKLTALHQGIEALHERGSVDDLPHSPAKTARPYVDRLLPWIDEHADSPFFVFLHVFDPHDPFRPYEPYDTMYTDEGEVEAQERRAAEMDAYLREQDGEEEPEGEPEPWDHPLPDAEKLLAAGVDPDAYVDTELDWYDGSIRGMDAEIGRVLERLEQLGILEDTLIVFMSDHGEEFLEHGRHFHGAHAYGEMINVPLMMWWPGVVPARRADEVVQSIDVYPTVLELAGLRVPEQAQGQSLLPLMADPERPSRLGWVARPAFAERAITEELTFLVELEDQVAQQVIIADGWKLVRNVERPEGVPEFELYDYLEDPLDQNDVAADHPEVVEQLSAELASWHESALAARIEEVSTEDMSPEELQQLRSLGYIQ